MFHSPYLICTYPNEGRLVPFLWLLKCSSNHSVTKGLGGSKIVSQNPITAFHKFCPLNVCPQPSKFFNLKRKRNKINQSFATHCKIGASQMTFNICNLQHLLKERTLRFHFKKEKSWNFSNLKHQPWPYLQKKNKEIKKI